ncbi:CHAT domain-containing protein [Roridomyces roridus]|uniref:CHAT domain-containing protein n=1 Tax=Roridomyces roridus TaxID=1738132 RepID=A0AAD7BAK9_9AGAR|nr:CHAT domain-containing protein [Roridomyces roridus]
MAYIGLGLALADRFMALGNLQDIDDAVTSLQASAVYTLPGDPLRAFVLKCLGDFLLRRFNDQSNINDLNDSVSLMNEANNMTPLEHLDKGEMVAGLAKALESRFKHLGTVDDLQKSLSLAHKALMLTPSGHLSRVDRLVDLGEYLSLDYKYHSNVASLNTSVTIMEEAVLLTPASHISRIARLLSLATTLEARFNCLGDVADIDRAMSLGDEAVHLMAHHNNSRSTLSALGMFLLSRFERYGTQDDLDQAVQLCRNAAHNVADVPDTRQIVHHLATVLTKCYELSGDICDLDESVSLRERVVTMIPEGHKGRPGALQNCAYSLCLRFQQFGNVPDLERSITMAQESFCLMPDNDSDKLECMRILYHSVSLDFHRLGDPSDINLCIQLAEHVVRTTPNHSPERPNRVRDLGSFLLRRFEQSGSHADLNLSISHHRAAVDLTPDDHVEKPSHLSSLGSALGKRFEQLGDLDDLNDAIEAHKRAIALTPAGDIVGNCLWLYNVTDLLCARHHRLGNLTDLERAVEIAEQVVQLFHNDHVEKPGSLDNLAGTLFFRFMRLHHSGDLNRCIDIERDALELMPMGHPGARTIMHNLAVYLFHRYQSSNDFQDLQDSYVLGKRAMSQTPDGHRDKPQFTMNHCTSLMNLQESLRFGDPQKLRDLLKAAAHSSSGPPRLRFDAASQWSRIGQVEGQDYVLNGYQLTLDLLPELAWLGVSIPDRYYQIRGVGQVARNACTAAITAGLPGRAVEWLEQGRSIIWGQLLTLRTPMHDLQAAHPSLAKKLLLLSHQLEAGGIRSIRNEAVPFSTHRLNGPLSHEITLERKNLLEEIRAKEKFDRFLLPRTLSQLSEAAVCGPVIVLNLSEDQCDALVLLPGTTMVKHLPLPEFTPELATTLAKTLQGLIQNSGARRNERLSGQRESKANTEDQFAHILAELWLKLVSPVVNALDIKVSPAQKLKRIWWCPTGVLTFLPIHAAGIYGPAETFGTKLSDFAISSYTPSLAALIEAFHRQVPRPGPVEETRLLAVAQPFVQGHAYIPGTQEEISTIEKHAIGKLPVARLDAEMATVSNVQAQMIDCSWVHFACHGAQNALEPTDSALLLADNSRLTVSNMIQMSLPQADFAFLSACQTANGSDILPDEAVHLAGGMLSAGYRSVIATMWAIMDNDAPQVAGDVYGYLLQTSKPDSRQAAEALHHAISKLRERPGSTLFAHWVPFIHVGI